jgi:AP-3 complex subunit beta
VSLALEPAAIAAVLNELRTYIRHGDKPFACAAIRAVGRVTELTRIVYDRHGASTGRPVEERITANRIAMDALYGLTVVTQTSDSKAVVGEAVSAMHNILMLLGSSNVVNDEQIVVVEDPNKVQLCAIRRILILLVNALSSRLKKSNRDDDEDHDDKQTELSKLSVHLPQAAVSSALWIVGEWLTNSPSLGVTVPKSQDSSKVSYELARLVARCFLVFSPEEKEQAVHFATKLWMSNALAQRTTQPSSSQVSMCEHILSMGRLDVNPDVKDRARYESAILHSCTGLKHDADAMDELQRPGSISLENAKKILLSRKPSASYLPIDDGASIDMCSFQFGTLSSLVGHRARGAYLTLPPWADKNSPSVLREPIEPAKERLASNFAQSSQPQLSGPSGFYADDNDSDSSSSTSSSSSESGGQNADSESESDSEDESSSESSDDQNLLMPKSQQNGQAQPHLLLRPMKSQQPKPSVPAFHANQSPPNSSDHEFSSSSSDSRDSSDASDANYHGDVSSANLFISPQPLKPQLAGVNGNIFGATDSSGFAPIPEVSNCGRSSAMDDLKGLVMTPIIVPDPAVSLPDTERDSSAWKQLVRPELCGGLSVKIRYLRGPTKKKELQLKNIVPSSLHPICVQLQFGNNKTDSTSIRRIKVLPRSGSSGPFATKKILCPPEILELKAGHVTTVVMVLEFASMSNRDGDLVGKLEIKQGSAGSIPVEIKPSLCELLRPPKDTSMEEFDAIMKRMQGFQRVESTFVATREMASIAKSVLKETSFATLEGKDNKLRFLAMLPASDDPVLVQVELSNGGNGKIFVCCDHAVAITSILSIVKQAVS